MDKPSRRLGLLCLLCLLCTIASAQEMMTVPLTAFNAGELSPKMEGRIDYPKYTQGLRTCENLLPLTQGPVIRRPGTQYVATTKDGGEVKLIPFEYSVSDTYMLEFGDLYMRVYRNQAQVLDANDNPYEIETPFDANELADLQFVQTANTMYLVDGNDPPQKLTRDGHDDWTIEEVDFTTGPFLPRITGNTTTIATNYESETDFNDVHTSYNRHIEVRSSVWAAQTFTPDVNYTATHVQLKLFRSFHPKDHLTVSIRATDANQPNGPDLTSGEMEEYGTEITTSDHGKWYTIEFDTPLALTAGTRYAIVARCPNAGTYLIFQNSINWKYHTAGSYAGGYALTSTNSGSSWSSRVNSDFTFVVVGDGQLSTYDTLTMTASDPLFDEDHIGSIWKLYHPRADRQVTGTLSSEETGDTLLVSGSYNATTQGTWTGTVALQRSFDGGTTWDAVQTIVSADDNNMNYSDTETVPNTLYRFAMTSYSSGSATYTISSLEYYDYGILKITDVTDPCTATATVLDDPVSGEATAIWQEGYWSGYRGWPRTVALHEQRLWFGGSTDYPQTIWATQTAEQEGDYEDMTVVGTNDDSALIYTLPGKNPIQWLHSQSYLMVGSAGGVGRLGSLNEGMTPTNIEYRLQTTNAAAGIQPVGIGDVLLYVERGGRKVRQYLYQYDVDQFIAPDVSILAEHITEGGLTGMALQQSPQPIVWCPRADGEAVTMTYLRDEEVIAWGRQITDGTIESIATLPGSNEDEVWWSVARTIDNNTVRYIEVLQPHDWGTDQNDCWFVDSGLSFDGGPAVPISNVNQTNPALVTVVSWPTDGDGIALADGDQVTFASVGGMTELNGNVYTIDDANSTDLTFTLNDSDDINDVNAIDFTAYTSGGTVQRVENTFAGIGHLAGKKLAIWADGAVLPDYQYTGTKAFDVWAIQRYGTRIGPLHPDNRIYYILVALTTDLAEYLSDGDIVEFDNVVGAPWMNAEWPITEVHSGLIYPPEGPRYVTIFHLADPNGNLFDATGLDFVSTDLPPTTMGVTCTIDEVVSDAGTIVTHDWYNTLIAGLPYTSTLETMPLIVPGDNGPMLHNLKRVTKIWADFYESIGATAGASEATLQDVDRGTTSTTLYTEWKEISDVAVGWFRKPTVWIRQEDPAPMTVRQIEATLRVGQ